MDKDKFLLLAISYWLLAICLFFYSFTQVDLNLTLTKISFWFAFQDFFQHIGYFQRPLSTLIYLILISLLFTNYYLLLRLVKEKKLSEKQLWWLILIISGTLLLSYPAFSYDIFNYMFDAKTVVIYHQNPYRVKPIDFQGIDPWLNFLHWTHRSSVFPPFWILLTTIPFILGFGKFLLILWNFKALMVLAYLGTIYFLGKILTKLSPEKKLLGLTFFAFNPLVIIESLVSAHLDVVMIFFALVSIYYLISQKRVISFLFLALSVAIKYVTLSLLPLIFLGFKRWLALILMAISLLVVIKKIEIQSWYFLWLLPFTAMIFDRLWLWCIAIGFSLGLLLRYAPFLYYGHWNPPVPTIKFWATIIPPVLFFLGWYFSKKQFPDGIMVKKRTKDEEI